MYLKDSVVHKSRSTLEMIADWIPLYRCLFRFGKEQFYIVFCMNTILPIKYLHQRPTIVTLPLYTTLKKDSIKVNAYAFVTGSLLKVKHTYQT